MTPGSGTAERVARNAALKVAVQATRLLSLVFLVVAARKLGPEVFGRFTFAYSLAVLLGAALDLGMHAVLVRGVARAREATAGQWTAAVTLKLALLLPAGAAFTVIPLLTHRPLDTAIAVWLLGAALALQSFIEVTVSVFTGFERLEYEFGLRLAEKLVLLAVGLTGLALGGGLVAVTGAFAVAALASLAFGVALVHRRFARLAWAWDSAGARALARTLGLVAVAFLLDFARTRLVPPVVALLVGDVAAGYFGAAVRVLDVLMILPVALVAGVYPMLARTPPGDPQFRRLVGQVVEVLLMIGLAVAVALPAGAAWLTTWVYGAAYAPAAPLLALLGTAACLAFVNYFLGFVFLALDRPRRLVVTATIGLVASLGLTPGLVRALGATGGALAVVLLEALTLATCLVALFPFIGLPLARGTVKAAIAATVAGLVAGLLPLPGGWRLGLTLLCYAGVLAGLRPVPAALWLRLLRGAAWPAERA